jgi:UDP-2-acetamido-3-amino-2,3-dideoxy-glucuronate N-acetyltransferase
MTVQVHPRGLCESADVGAGTRVWAFAHVLAGAKVGRGCNICDGAYVEGGAVLGDNVTVKNHTLVYEGVTCEDDVFLGPNVVFTNDMRPRAAIKRGREEFLPTLVRRGASLGAGTVVVCGTTVGEFAFAAAGSVLARDVPAHAFVAGNPARQKGWVCACGQRLAADLRCPGCGNAYRPGSDRAGGLVPAGGQP